MNRRLNVVLVTLVVMALMSTGLASAMRSPAALAAPVITITDLGTLGESSQAWDINNQGQIVGVFVTGDNGVRAFLWQDGIMTDLGTLGGGYSYAFAINNPGQIVGQSRTADGQYRAFLWQEGVMTDLGTLGGHGSSADGINDLGQIVGSSASYAFLWEDGMMTDLGTGVNSTARGINDRGQVAGSSSAGGQWRAFLWEDGAVIDLGHLGGGYSFAWAINDLGQIVGDSTTADGQRHAFRWQGGVMTDLGTLGGDFSTARGINNLSQIAGYSSTADGMTRAFLWEDGMMTDLGSLDEGWSWAHGINDLGQIVGQSGHRATLWTVSAPVLTPEQAIANLVAELEALVADGRLEARWAHGLRAKLDAAQLQLDKSNTTASANVLGAFINQVEATVKSGRLTAEAAQPLIDGAHVVMELLQP